MIHWWFHRPWGQDEARLPNPHWGFCSVGRASDLDDAVHSKHTCIHTYLPTYLPTNMHAEYSTYLIPSESFQGHRGHDLKGFTLDAPEGAARWWALLLEVGWCDASNCCTWNWCMDAVALSLSRGCISEKSEKNTEKWPQKIEGIWRWTVISFTVEQLVNVGVSVVELIQQKIAE